jgi:hypothetical protein
LRCLIEAINRDDQEKQATPKKRASHGYKIGIISTSLMQALIKEKKQANHNKR